MRRALALAAVLGGSMLAACRPAPASQPTSSSGAVDAGSTDQAANARADATIAQVMSRRHVPGMALVVVRNGKVVKQSAYGTASLELGVPVTADTRFQLASATKVLTGTLVMLLIQEQLLALDAPVRQYLPDVPPAWESITIAQLAAHASGIPDPSEPTGETLEEVNASLAKQPLAFAPGTRAQYGLSDLFVLTRAMEKVTGKRYDQLLVERLGLQCTGFDNAREDGRHMRNADVIPGRVGVYRWQDQHQRTAEGIYGSAAHSQGGAFACTADLARWAVAMDGGKLLSPASEQLATARFQLLDGSPAPWSVVFTAGTVLGHKVYGHPGGPALGDIVRFPDQKLTVVVLSNQKAVYPNTASVIAQHYLPRPVLPPALREAPELRAKLEQAEPAQVAALPPLDRIELVRENRYRATYGDIVISWKLAPDGELMQLIE